MKLTHLGHSCVLVETAGAKLLIDPGVWSSSFEDLRDLDAVLVTHQHPDHLDPDRLGALMAANQHAELVVDPGSESVVAGLGLAARAVRPGDALEVAGTAISVVGGEHAEVHPEIPIPPNVGYVIDHGALYHPGDALFVPEQRVDVLALPAAAPWLKLSEAVDFFRAVGPRVAFPIHERVLSDTGIAMVQARLADLAPAGAELKVLVTGEGTEVDPPARG